RQGPSTGLSIPCYDDTWAAVLHRWEVPRETLLACACVGGEPTPPSRTDRLATQLRCRASRAAISRASGSRAFRGRIRMNRRSISTNRRRLRALVRIARRRMLRCAFALAVTLAFAETTAAQDFPNVARVAGELLAGPV